MSTAEQANKGLSLEAQIEKCLVYARAHGLTLGKETNCGTPGVFVDGGTSATKKSSLASRPGGQQLLMALLPGDHVVFTSPHRAFRNLLQSELQLKRWGDQNITVHFVEHNIRSDSPNGRLVLQLMFAVAEWKARINGARTREGLSMRSMPELEQEIETTEMRDVGAIMERAKDTLSEVWIDRWEEKMNPPPREIWGKVHFYIRVSKAEQNVEVQQELLDRWFRSSEFSHLKVEVHVDHGVSAYKNKLVNRKAGRAMLKKLKEGDVVVCLRADRMCRSMSDMVHVLEEFDHRGITAVMLDCGLRTDNAFGKLLLGMLSFVAQLESVETSRSTIAALKVSYQAKGLPLGGIPKWMRKPVYVTRTPMIQAIDEEVWARAVWKAYQLFEKGLGCVKVSKYCNQYVCEEMGWPRWEFVYTRNNELRRGAVTVQSMLDDIDEVPDKEKNASLMKLRSLVRRQPKAKKLYGFFPETWVKDEYLAFKGIWERLLKKEEVNVSDRLTIIKRLLELHNASRSGRSEKPSDL